MYVPLLSSVPNATLATQQNTDIQSMIRGLHTLKLLLDLSNYASVHKSFNGL